MRWTSEMHVLLRSRLDKNMVVRLTSDSVVVSVPDRLDS